MKYNSESNSHIDHIFYKYISVIILPILKKLGFTPNIITIIGFILKLLSLYLLYYTNHVVIAGLLFFLGYIFDCLDGAFAREYNMETRFGDYLDHFCDITSYILLLYVAYIKYGLYFTLLLVFLQLISIYHLSCQEQTTDKKSATIMNCCLDNYHSIKYNVFGCGNIMLLISILLIIIHPLFYGK